MTTHLLSSSTVMNSRNRGTTRFNSAPPNHRMNGYVAKRVVVDGQFDDAVNESPPSSPTWIVDAVPSNPVHQGVATRSTQTNAVPVLHTTTTTIPQHPWWSFGPTTMLVLHHSAVIPPVAPPLTTRVAVMTLSAAPPPPLGYPFPNHLLPPLQPPLHNQGVWPRTALPNTRPFHHHHHVPIATPPTPKLAPRPVRPTYLPIAPRPAALGNGTLLPATTATTTTHKKRCLSMKKLPTREMLCHSPHGDDIGIASSYGTKLVDRIIHRSNDQSRPFHNLLTHHPSATLIPQSGVPPRQRIPMMKLVPRDEKCACPVSVLHNMRPADVLLGRGGTSNRNMGNLYFRQLISYYRCFYHVLPKGSKGQLSRNICNYVRMSGGRFLEKRRHHADYWYECGDARALAKCSQALRETNCVRICTGDSGTKDEQDNDDDYDNNDDDDDNDDNDNDDDDDDDSSSGGDMPHAKKMRYTK